MIMKEMKEYIRKHDRHFTVQLAMDIGEYKRYANKVKRTTDALVYYSASKATLGDMVFLVNLFAYSLPNRKCIEYYLGMVGNMNAGGRAFNT